jgi:hypothetical protein
MNKGSAKANANRLPKPEKKLSVGTMQDPKVIPNRLWPGQKGGGFLMFFDLF